MLLCWTGGCCWIVVKAVVEDRIVVDVVVVVEGECWKSPTTGSGGTKNPTLQADILMEKLLILAHVPFGSSL